MKASSFRVANTNKTQIVLHYSAGSQLATAQQSIDAVNNRTIGGYSYHYLILANGDVEQMVPDKDIAFHTYTAGVNTHAIGVSFENYGWCFTPDRSSYGRIPASQTRAVKLVDFNGNPKPYKQQTYAQEITDAQLAALGPLIRKIKGNNPGITWPGLNSSTFQTVFSERVIWSASNPGIYSHGAVQADKADILPTPKMIAALKLIGPL
jgi:N-acetyl-anhydromuramyl-L-alanine amidase AmpD